MEPLNNREENVEFADRHEIGKFVSFLPRKLPTIYVITWYYYNVCTCFDTMVYWTNVTSWSTSVDVVWE